MSATLLFAMRRFAMALGWLLSASWGCATPPPADESRLPPITLSGPPCGQGDPSLEIVRAEFQRCGKGDTCTVVDFRIRNPTDRALWLLLDGEERFLREKTEVSTLVSWRSPAVTLWTFYGQSVDRAARLLPKADVTLRNLTYTTRLTEFRAVFLERISLGDYADIGTLEPKGFLPLAGDVDLDGIGGFITRVRGRSLRRFERMAQASVTVRCVSSVAVP